MTGLTNLKTIETFGQVAGHEVVVMIGPGATHDFFSYGREKKWVFTLWNHEVLTSGTLTVVKGSGECQGMVLELQVLMTVEA